MGPPKPIPYGDAFSSTEEYVESLLDLVANNDLFRTLCGGVHILDFFTSDPPIYTTLLPAAWRDFFAQHSMMNLLHLYMREDLEPLTANHDQQTSWRDGPFPPDSLVEYIKLVRKHLLQRELETSQCARNRTEKKFARHVSVGMNVKKMHEVGLFASYVDSLATQVSASLAPDQAISHLVDFGSGQGYLGRALASEPYNRNIVAIESKSHNAERARDFDVKAELVQKAHFLRNKKAFRAGLVPPDHTVAPQALPTPPPEFTIESHQPNEDPSSQDDVEQPAGNKGSVQYLSHRLQSGDLANLISNVHKPEPRNLMVISLHSCGNLVHHGLRSLTLNPSVKAVAMVGCCYNLLTERLGPATLKLPSLRPSAHQHPRLQREGERRDPDGFPMSRRFCEYDGDGGAGIRVNITARMMAVQAPPNWGERDSASFFTRHFFRALLQRIFLDRGVVGPPSPACVGGSPGDGGSGGTPIIIGSLKKSCYADFVAYVRGAVEKLDETELWGSLMRDKMHDITDGEILAYEEKYRERHKDLSVTWSLMAFSAAAVEAAIVVDRWLWLMEQEEVKEAWVENVFDYRLSPRNLVVVGIKK